MNTETMVAWRYSQARALNVRPARQSGSVVVITAISLFVLIGMIGLALDTSHLLVNKTGLQNAMDTAALSAAAAINAGYSCDEATTQSKATLSRFLAENGNADISSHVTLDNVVYQSPIIWAIFRPLLPTIAWTRSIRPASCASVPKPARSAGFLCKCRKMPRSLHRIRRAARLPRLRRWPGPSVVRPRYCRC
ncbi:TadE/TadG family type IV pilus assembly protein [Methylogaea oryzae]|uniref:TadE/TadG family type IV pilus assembly protein n=1 Tax=Methylogaea oryzae TaxID=1295382 RepID=UPI0020D12108|nr:Tad domain-containing protein [Methylogaea oryzae]